MFSDKGIIYYENGLNVMPVGAAHSHEPAKRPIFDDWSQWSNKKISEDLFNQWVEAYPKHGIGLITGKVSGVIAIDYDYKGEDSESLGDLIRHSLPKCEFTKKGEKGFTLFFKYSNDIERKIQIKRTAEDKSPFSIVEVLTNGQYTVMPPSKHKTEGLYYIWTQGTLEEFKVDNLSQITLKDIDWLRSCIYRWFQQKGIVNELEDSGGRNNSIFKYACKIFNSFKGDVEAFAKELLAFDRETNGAKAWFDDKRESSRGKGLESALKFARSAIKSIQRQQEARGENPKELGEEKNKNTYEEYKQFFENHFPNTRKCLLRKSVFADDGRSIENEIKATRSYATDKELPTRPLEDHLYRWMSEKKPELFFKMLEHDPSTDPIAHILSFVRVKNIKHEHFVEIFKGWFAGVFYRLDNSDYQNTMIVLEGNQGLGKDSLIKAMAGYLKPYFSNCGIHDKEIENYQTMARTLVFNISEFDRSSKVSVAQIKNMITAPNATFRASYARAPAEIEFKTSFISSCNLKDIFKDVTGNRRYSFFEVTDIDWNYPKDLSPKIIAQAKWLFDNKFKVSDEALASMKQIMENLTPEDDIEDILDSWNDCCNRNKQLMGLAGGFTGTQAQVFFNEIADLFKTNTRRVRHLVKINGAYRRTATSRLWNKATNLRIVEDNTKINNIVTNSVANMVFNVAELTPTDR